MASNLAALVSEHPPIESPIRTFPGVVPLGLLAELKLAAKASVSVVIPARNEGATIASIVGEIRSKLVDEVSLVDDIVVVDDGSSDDTARKARDEGARLLEGPVLGKGEAMAVAVRELSLARRGAEDLVVFLDGDVTNFGQHFVSGLVAPLLAHGELEFVKATYRRPLGPDPTGGGRVTELVAKPALSLLLPELAGVTQPLAGECALRGSLLPSLCLEGGYGVEVAMLIDIYRTKGPRALAQVDLGVRQHRNRPLKELVPQAREVLDAILIRTVS